MGLLSAYSISGELSSKLLVSPLITPIILPDIIPYKGPLLRSLDYGSGNSRVSQSRHPLLIQTPPYMHREMLQSYVLLMLRAVNPKLRVWPCSSSRAV